MPDPAGAESDSFEAGLLVKDRYLIERQLGHGGFGAVFLARDTTLHDRPVVVKVLRGLAGGDEEWSRRKFAAEAQALASIDHPGVVQVLDRGEIANQPYLVMQFVEGATLTTAIGPQGMDLGRAARILEQVGQALTAAHEQGICHRDLKPDNIMLRGVRDGKERAMLIDFGIAAVPDRNDTTGRGTRLAGTFPYMAPEQMSGGPGHFSDIYAMGVIAYEMVTGGRPFALEPHDPPMRLWFLQRDGAPTGPLDARAGLPGAAREAILKALSFEPKDRYARACDFGDAFAAAIGGSTARLEAATPVPPPPAMLSQAVEMAAVLFLDIVSYSLQPMDRQTALISKLQEIVRGTAQFGRAQKRSELISLPTGDGMALVFFNNTVAPVKCALEISRALQQHPELKLRMGMHSGPVYRHEDIKNELNVVGGGINMAQRVMDCGDAGHILLSRPVADVLGQLTGWGDCLQDLGECQVKHGVSIHIYNLYKDGLGNPELPAKIAKLRGERASVAAVATAPLAPPTAAPAPIPLPPPPPVQTATTMSRSAAPSPARGRAGILIGAGVLLAVAVGGYVALHKAPPPAVIAPAPVAASQSPATPAAESPLAAPTPPAAVPAPIPHAAEPARFELRTNPRDGQNYIWIPGAAGAKAFWIGQTEVTQRAYTALMGTNPSKTRGAQLPVESVTWDDAQAYCSKAGMHLPSEAEWENAEPSSAIRAKLWNWMADRFGSASEDRLVRRGPSPGTSQRFGFRPGSKDAAIGFRCSGSM